MSKNLGFTLLELLVVGAIVSILAAFSFSYYQQHVLNGRLQDAKAALLNNALFMERWYVQHGNYKANSTTWPILPHIETEFFIIDFTSKAKGVDANRYYLSAVAKDIKNEPRYIVLDQFNELKTCDKSSGKVKCKAG